MKEVKNTYYEDYLKWKENRKQNNSQSFKNKKTEDDIPVDTFFENKFEEKYKSFYDAVKKYLYDKWEVKDKKEFDGKFTKESKLKEVDIDDICPTQEYVSKKILEEKMKNDHFKSSKIQLLKYDGEYFLFDGHHRTAALIEEGYKTVKDEVLNLGKIKDFERDIEEYLPKDYDLYDIVGKSVISDLNKAFEEKYIDEQTYDILLEKAWKKQPIGTVTTRKDGQKYRKVSETGNMDQDWKLVSKDKAGMAKPESKRSGEAKQVKTKQSKENLQESAKNTSETALNNAIKQSSDPEVRQAAYEELQRRESEEKPKEEEKKDDVNDLDKLEEIKQNLLKKVDELSKLHKKLYSNIDIESPKSEDEKKIDKEISDIFSEINSIVIKKRKIKKEQGIQKSEEIDLEKAKDQIKGGLADKLSIKQIAEKHGVSVKSIKKQIKLGKKVEMEHTDDPDKAKEIARDHVSEFKDYYTRLAKMEDEAKKENKKD